MAPPIDPAASKRPAEQAPEAAPMPTAEPAPTAPFVWPVMGPVTNTMAPGHPLGIDIGLAVTPNSVVHAAAEGHVVFTGGHECCSYGLYVVVEHASGLRSLYAHLSRIDVAVGQPVGQRQPLGLSGDTGVSTADHLHFEVRGAKSAWTRWPSCRPCVPSEALPTKPTPYQTATGPPRVAGVIA